MKSHGYVEFSWESNILYVEAFGPFNEEGVMEAASEYLSTILNRTVSDFSVIEIWDEDSLGSPEALAYVEKLWEQLISNGCTSIALVVSNSLQRGVAEKFLPSIGKIFHKKEDAKFWIHHGRFT